MIKSLTYTLAALVVGTSFAFAAEEKKPAAAPAAPGAAAKADKPKRDPAETFKKLDSNSDGKVSADEFKASPQAKKDEAKAMEMFGKKDKDGDKNLTLEEYSAAGKKKDK